MDGGEEMKDLRFEIRDLLSAFLLTALLWPSIAMAEQAEPTRKLAVELSNEDNHPASAIEWRRLALGAESAEHRAGYYWAAAHEYWQAQDYYLTEKMLARSESESRDIATQAILLRAMSSLESKDLDTSQFHLTSLRRKDDPDTKALASLRLSEVMLLRNDIAGAEDALSSSAHSDNALRAIKEYKGGHDKSPRLGGLLGIIPGLGYAYSGEYANAFRSLILNSIFIYGMADTAGDDEWGAFAAITFFELTWYTGSIYGGVDSAHRYNNDRLDRCIQQVRGNSGFSPDLSQVPAISLKFRF